MQKKETAQEHSVRRPNYNLPSSLSHLITSKDGTDKNVSITLYNKQQTTRK